MTEISSIIMNEVSGYHVICAYCQRSHYGMQIFNDKLKDYVCMNCADDLEAQDRSKRA